MASSTAFFVISWYVILLSFLAGIFKKFLRWYAMASPSLSGSEAIYTLSAFSTSALRFLTTSFLSGLIVKSISKSPLTSIPKLYNPVFLISQIWPTEAATLYFLSRNDIKVLTLFGDSTIIKSNPAINYLSMTLLYLIAYYKNLIPLLV